MHDGGVLAQDRWPADVERLYRAHSGAVMAFLRGRLPAADADDLAAETFRRAAVVLKADPDARIGRAWLMAVARNATIDRWRRERRWTERMAAVRGELDRRPDEPLGGATEQILAALDELDDRHRAVLVLHFVEGMTAREIAGVLGKSTAAVESLVRRARERLRGAYARTSSP